MSGYGVGWTQDDMMKKDMCILLDDDDNMVGHASKVESHQFNKKTLEAYYTVPSVSLCSIRGESCYFNNVLQIR